MSAAAAFDADGYALLPGVLNADECEQFASRLVLDDGAAGSRCLLSQPWCAALAQRLQAHAALADIVPGDHLPVQCNAFEKSPDRNWLVPVHQDLSIPVAGRVANDALRGWSAKEGRWFVQAPDALLAQLVAVRLHLDDCLEEDGVLRVAPASHRAGRIGPEDAARWLAAHGVACPSRRGGLLAMRPLLLHASSKSRGKGRRRVLHFVFAPREPGHGLRWPDKEIAS